MAEIRTIDRMATRLLSDGFNNDDIGNAKNLLGKFPPEEYCDVRGYVSLKRRDGWPIYVVLAEIKGERKDVWKRGRKFDIPTGSLLAVYETVGRHYERYFGADGKPLEGDEEAKLVGDCFRFAH